MNVRAGPGADYASLGQVRQGDRFTATARNQDGKWLKVTWKGQDGWLATGYLEVTGDAASLPVASADVTSLATPGPSPAAPSGTRQSYAIELSTQLQLIAGASQALVGLTQEPDLADADWKSNVTTQVAIVRLAYRNLTKMDVPPDMADIHATVLDATSDCDHAMDHLESGLDNSSADDIQAAADLIASCGKSITVSH